MNTKQKVIFFDFDGTIADTFDTLLQLLNRLSEVYKYEKVEDPKVILKFRNQSASQIIKHFRISKLKILFMLKRVRKEIQKEIPHVHTFEGMHEVLDYIKENDIISGIISSNSPENIDLFLKKNNLNNFHYIIGDVGVFGKASKLKQIKKKFKDSEVFYVGDELRDIDAARKARVNMISVGWGYNTEETLKKHNSKMLATKPKDIIKFLV